MMTMRDEKGYDIYHMDIKKEEVRIHGIYNFKASD